jgi:hypothetical protein
VLYSEGSAGVPGVGVQEEDSVEGEEQIKDFVLTCALFLRECWCSLHWCARGRLW